MKLIKYELLKLCGKKTLFAVIILLFLLNAFLFSSVQSKVHFKNTPQYQAVEAEFSQLDPQEAYTELTLMSEYLRCIQFVKMYNENKMPQDETKKTVQTQLDNATVPISYDELIKRYGNYLDNEDKLNETASNIYEMQRQLQSIVDYPKFINNMQKKASDMTSISIFNDENSFAYRNIIKTTQDFSHLKDIKLSVGHETGIINATNFPISDYFIIAIILLLCIYLFSDEKEKGLLQMVKSTKRGRFPVAAAKSATLILLTVIIACIFYGTILVISNSLYGFGDLNRYIQSMPGFRDANILMTVNQYLVVCFATKILVLVFIAVVFSLCFVLISEVKFVYVILGAFLGISYICYAFIHPLSYVNVFKYLNIFSILDTYHLYAWYSNINLFGFPISRISSSFWVLIIALSVFLTAYFIFFTKNNIFSSRLLYKISSIKLFKRTKIKGSTSLFSHEIYKIFISNKLYLVLAVAILVGYQSINLNELLLDIDDNAYYQYATQLSGEVSKEKSDFIEKEQQRFDDVPKEMSKLEAEFRNAKIDFQEYNTKIFEIKTFSDMSKGFMRAKRQYENLIKLQKERGIQVSFINEISSNYIFGQSKRDLLTGLVYAVLLLLAICNMFPMERKNSMINLLRSTKHGRLKLFYYKYLIALFISFIVMIILYLPYYLTLFLRYGILLNAPIQSIASYQYINSIQSVGGFMICSILSQLLTAFVMVSVIILISELVKKQTLTLIISIVLICAPILLSLANVNVLDYFSLNNGFNLYQSYSVENSAINNTLYFVVLFAVGCFCTVSASFIFCGKSRSRIRNAKNY